MTLDKLKSFSTPTPTPTANFPKAPFLMQKEPGDEYVRRTATYIRDNATALAADSRARRVQQAPQAQGAAALWGWGWLSKQETSLVYSTDLHHILYLLMRFEDLGVDVGPLDIRLPTETISRPLSYVSLLAAREKSDNASIFSFRSISGVSKMSLGAGWWPRSEQPSVETELKSIYSAFNKLPALSVHQSTLNVIAELADDPPIDHAVPLYVFKCLQKLECVDIDPRMVMGWDRLAESLRSLTIRKSGIDDVTEIFVDAVVGDEARRRGETVKSLRQKAIHKNLDSRRPSWRGPPPISPPIHEESESPSSTTASSPAPQPQLSGLKWAFLQHLSLSDNALTFFPQNVITYLTSLRYLDLSSNLLVSVPAGLKELYNLVALNLSDNMIESVLGIYTMLGQVLTLNLSRNRIDSLCGLERLVALERIDVRKNSISDIEEVGRLATLPNLQEVWVEGNSFTESDPNYRVTCFNQFLKENKNVTLDGNPPTFLERRSLIAPPPESVNAPAIKSPEVAPSPPVVAIGSPIKPSTASPAIAPDDSIGRSEGKPESKEDSKSEDAGAISATNVVNAIIKGPSKKKKPTRRVVDLDGTSLKPDNDTASVKRGYHRRGQSENPNHLAITASSTTGTLEYTATTSTKTTTAANATPQPAPGIAITVTSAAPPPPVSRPSRKSSHTRGMSTDESGLPASPPLRSSRATGQFVLPGSATISGTGTMPRRRSKLSPAMFSPSGDEASSPTLAPSIPGTKAGAGGSPGSPGSPRSQSPSHSPGGLERFRAEIEALRATAPDNWLKVLSQKHFGDSSREGSRVGSPDPEGDNSKRRRHWRGVTDF